MMDYDTVRITEVLSFWYGRVPRPEFGLLDALLLPTRIPCWAGHWASRFYDVDDLIRRQFGGLLKLASDGEVDHWAETAKGRLALMVVLDQFSRNIYRDTPAAFAQDQKTLPLALDAVERGLDRWFYPLARSAFYLPIMHQEDLELQERCIELYQAARDDASPIERAILNIELASSRRHRDIIRQFGRFPHRNKTLGRETTKEEARFLTRMFSSF